MKRVFSVFSFLLIVVFLNGQYDPKENFYDAEFFFAEEDYSEALYAFNQVYNDGFQDNANINYRIGICMLQIDGKKKESIPYLEKAVQKITEKYKEGSFKEVSAPPDAYLYLGNAYRINMQFDEAVNSYNKFLEFTDDNSAQAFYTKLQIESCSIANTAVESQVCYEYGDLGQINEIRAPVYNPAISGDLKTFAFMGRQKFYNGVYVSKNIDGKWLKPYNITPSIQSDGNQHVLALSNDGTKILLAWDDQFESDIWMSEYKNDRWYKSEPLSKPVNSKYYESHACFTPDGNGIYFTSNRIESLGEMDIFYCSKKDDGSWGDLVLLGENVNTSLNEDNPYVSPDGKRLYFSSQGHSGLGGFDIYYCDILNDGTPGKPVNMGYPLNTSDDDFAFMPRQINFDGYISFFAKGDQDQVDIFRFELIPEFSQPLSIGPEIPANINENCINPVQEEVLASVTEEAIEEVAIEEPTEDVVEDVTEAMVEEVTEEIVEEVAEETPEEVTEVVTEVVSESYKLKPVFFEFDSYNLSETAKDKLNGLVTVMNNYPGMQLEIVGHTDGVGADSYNIILAKNRAGSVANYLKSKGISGERLTVSSKGESSPVAMNRTLDNKDNPKGRELNRRVQFNVTIPGGILIEVEKIEVPDELKIR